MRMNRRKIRTAGPTGTQAASAKRTESLARKKVKMQALDVPGGLRVTPVEPRCRKCGETFSTEQELLVHARTCRGGHQPRRLHVR